MFLLFTFFVLEQGASTENNVRSSGEPGRGRRTRIVENSHDGSEINIPTIMGVSNKMRCIDWPTKDMPERYVSGQRGALKK